MDVKVIVVSVLVMSAPQPAFSQETPPKPATSEQLSGTTALMELVRTLIDRISSSKGSSDPCPDPLSDCGSPGG